MAWVEGQDPDFIADPLSKSHSILVGAETDAEGPA